MNHVQRLVVYSSFFFFQRLLKTTLSQKTLYSQVIKHDYEMEVKWGEG